MRESHDTVIIGGGQAGLAMSSVLRRHGREHVVLERRRIGERWRTERWDSLRFQFPNWTVQLPECRYAGDDPDGFAHYGEILRFLEDYAASTRAPVREHTEVVGCEADDTGFVLSTTDSVLHARRVVVATGPFQRPLIPQPAHDIPPSVLQTDPTRYRCPAQLPDGAVLVVGSGASGCQIADELLHAGRRVYLSVSRHRRAPRRFRGRDVYWWLEKLGRFAQTIDSFPDRRWPPSTVITGVNGGYNVNVRQLAADGVAVVGRVAGASQARSRSTPTPTRSSTTPTPHTTTSCRPPASSRPPRSATNSPRNSPSRRRGFPPRSRRSTRSTSPAPISRRSFGRPATPTTSAGSSSRSSTSAVDRPSIAVSPSGPACTSLGCTGCTRSSRGCWPESATTPSTSPTSWAY